MINPAIKMINDSIEATVDGKNLYFLSKTTINNNMHVYTNTFIIPAWASYSFA